MKVKSCTVDPTSINLGGRATLTIALDVPAPAGGITIAIDIDSDGAQDTLDETPTGITLLQGSLKASITLQTSVVRGAATRIIFTAALPGGADQSAQLNISQ